MEEWVLLGESDSDADTVQFFDGSDSASDNGSEMSFMMVQIGGSRAADALDSSVDGSVIDDAPPPRTTAVAPSSPGFVNAIISDDEALSDDDAEDDSDTAESDDATADDGSNFQLYHDAIRAILGSSDSEADDEYFSRYSKLPESPIGGKNEDEEEESNDDYFDLNLPALAGSKAVFGASDDYFDLNLAAGILSMGNIGYIGDDTGIHSAEIKATDSDADEEQPESFTGARYLDDIDTENLARRTVMTLSIQSSSVPTAPTLTLRALTRRRVTTTMTQHPEFVNYDDIDTESCDAAESDYAHDTEHPEFVRAGYDDIDTESSDAAESDYDDANDDTESSDEEESDNADDSEHPDFVRADYDGIDTESSDAGESDYADGTEHPEFVRDDYDDVDTESSDAAGSDDGDDTESSDRAESDCSNDTRNSEFAGDMDGVASALGLAMTDAQAMQMLASVLARAEESESALQLTRTALTKSSNDAWKAGVNEARRDVGAATAQLRRLAAGASTAASQGTVACHVFPLSLPNKADLGVHKRSQP